MVKRIGVAAVAKNGVIGVSDQNEMPWRLAEYAYDLEWNSFKNPASFRRLDMAYFKDLTKGQALIMGRRTWESIPETARPLEGRDNYVVSDTMKREKGFYVVSSIDSALERIGGQKDVIFMGGYRIYADAIERNLLDELHITQIHKDFDGDVLFPAYKDKFVRDSSTDLWVHPNTGIKATIDIYKPL